MLTKSKVLSNKILSNTGLDISGSKLSNVVNNNITVTSKESCKNNPYDSITITDNQPKSEAISEQVDEPIKEEVVKYD